MAIQTTARDIALEDMIKEAVVSAETAYNLARGTQEKLFAAYQQRPDYASEEDARSQETKDAREKWLESYTRRNECEKRWNWLKELANHLMVDMEEAEKNEAARIELNHLARMTMIRTMLSGGYHVVASTADGDTFQISMRYRGYECDTMKGTIRLTSYHYCNSCESCHNVSQDWPSLGQLLDTRPNLLDLVWGIHTEYTGD